MDELWRKRLVGAGSMKEVSKWAGLVAAIWVQSFAGNSAAYANYSSKLKSVLTLTQVQLNYLALCKDLGENVGILAGLVCNKVPPWVILSVAALEGFIGFGSLWLVASGTISPRPLWQCSLYHVHGEKSWSCVAQRTQLTVLRTACGGFQFRHGSCIRVPGCFSLGSNIVVGTDSLHCGFQGGNHNSVRVDVPSNYRRGTFFWVPAKSMLMHAEEGFWSVTLISDWHFVFGCMTEV